MKKPLSRDSKMSSDSPSNLYRKPAMWTEENHQWVSRYVPSLPLDALVCDACTKFVKRKTGKTDVVPHWLPKQRTVVRG